jgi:DNA-3-methyladenine glycosylase
LTGDKLYVVDSPLKKNEEVGVSRRIGISKSVELPWRFFIKDNPYISRK